MISPWHRIVLLSKGWHHLNISSSHQFKAFLYLTLMDIYLISNVLPQEIRNLRGNTALI